MSNLAFLVAALLITQTTNAYAFRLGTPFRPPLMDLELDAAPIGPVISRNGTILPPYNTTYWFDQLIDHNNPNLGTFKQRYWNVWEFYEYGGPVVLFTPGEGNADGYADSFGTNKKLTGQIAQQMNGSVVILEHRFFGLSNPRDNLKSESLKLLTIQQAIDDFDYFMNNVVLPQPEGNNVKPNTRPWILVGGSYSGALTSWTMVNKPDLFAAGYASSAVVEAVFDFWKYFEPIRKNMAANCSADVQAVVAHIDEVFTGENKTAIQEIKDLFGLGNMTHLDDVAVALAANIYEWQSLGTNSDHPKFYEFCDTLEVKDGVSVASGRGLDHALLAWGNYWTQGGYLQQYCGGNEPEICFGTYDPTSANYTDTSVDNYMRSWTWMVCNEVGYFQDGAPKGHPSLVTRLVGPSYSLRICQFMFPDAFPEPPKTELFVDRTNQRYQGWDTQAKNIFFANGERDPWKEATMSAEGLNIESTPERRIALSNGFHGSDLSIAQGLADSTVLAVQKAGLAAIKEWVDEWRATHPVY